MGFRLLFSGEKSGWSVWRNGGFPEKIIAVYLAMYVIMSAGNKQCQTYILHNMAACRRYCARYADDRVKPVHRWNARRFRNALQKYGWKENRMNQVNYQKELEKILNTLQEKGEAASDYRPPRLFLHSCCAPCSSYCLEYLCRYFLITVFYYNPNISFSEEYHKRVVEQKRLIAAYNREEKGWPIDILEGDYEPERFYEMAKGYENCPEGGERCFRCFDLRLRKTAELALGGGYDYFATTLTISPLKNAAKINEIGQAISGEYEVPWLPSDFKKKNGYKRSIELSAEYELYRQNYCGCAFSKAEREAQTENV